MTIIINQSLLDVSVFYGLVKIMLSADVHDGHTVATVSLLKDAEFSCLALIG